MLYLLLSDEDEEGKEVRSLRTCPGNILAMCTRVEVEMGKWLPRAVGEAGTC